MMAAENEDIVLVVDDTVESLQFLTETIGQAGMTALVAKSGEAALELLGRVSPSIILMDAVMPGMNGFETTKSIKRNPEWSHIPIMFMTGLTDTRDVLEALEAGGVDYVRKPIIIEELLGRLKVHLSNAKAANASRGALDAISRHLLSVNRDGRVLWSTMEAERLLLELDPTWDKASERAPEALRKLAEEGGAPGSFGRIESDCSTIEAVIVSNTAPNEILIRLNKIREGDEPVVLAGSFGLTQREAEVLLWVSYGKSNRVISENLGISPRTINKHLESIFDKLDVETRAAAAAMAVRVLSQ